MGSSGLARLQGLFAVYKPPGLKWLHLRETVELQLLKGECFDADPLFCISSTRRPTLIRILPAESTQDTM